MITPVIRSIYKRLKPSSLALALCLLLIAVNGFAQDKLVFALDVIRHGDRTPTILLPGDNPALWPEGLGKLTAEGTNQEYGLGSRMRSLYLDSGLLSSNDIPGTICVFSTARDRTKASAQIFLKGLLADSRQSILIQTNIPVDIRAGISRANSISADKLLIPNERRDFKKLLSKYVLHTPAWLSTNMLSRPQFARWSRALNTNIVNIHNLIIPADALYVHQVHHVPLTIPLGPDDVQTIIDLGRWAFVYEYQAEVGQITGKPFLKKIAEYVNNASQQEIIQKKIPVKYILFSAHDSTLLSEMSTLRTPLTNGNVPPYASILHFALFETSRTNFYVQVTYHDNTDHIVPNPFDGGGSWTLGQLSRLTDQ